MFFEKKNRLWVWEYKAILTYLLSADVVGIHAGEERGPAGRAHLRVAHVSYLITRVCQHVSPAARSTAPAWRRAAPRGPASASRPPSSGCSSPRRRSRGRPRGWTRCGAAPPGQGGVQLLIENMDGYPTSRWKIFILVSPFSISISQFSPILYIIVDENIPLTFKV